MPIQPYEPPEQCQQALHEAMGTLPKAYHQMAEKIQAATDNWQQFWPHPVYCVGLKEMSSPAGLRKAELIGWRFLGKLGNDRNYALEVQVDKDGKNYYFSELDKGPYIDGIYRIVNDEALIKKTGATIFRPAILRINAMAVFAVWLRTGDAEKDILIPLPPNPSYVTPWQQYSINHFQDALREQAREKLANVYSDA